MLRTAYCDDHRFGIWIKTFEILGALGPVRRAYDEYYFAPDKRVGRYIINTRPAYANAGATATTIDLAMGVDGQTQFTPRGNVQKVSAAVRSAGPHATAAQQRAAISDAGLRT
jgi:hypothetical protein